MTPMFDAQSVRASGPSAATDGPTSPDLCTTPGCPPCERARRAEAALEWVLGELQRRIADRTAAMERNQDARYWYAAGGHDAHEADSALVEAAIANTGQGKPAPAGEGAALSAQREG